MNAMTAAGKSLKSYALIELVLGVFYLLAIPAVPDAWWSYLATGLVSVLFGLVLLAAAKSAAGRKAAWALAIVNLALTVLGLVLNLKSGAGPAALVSVAVDLLYALGVLVPLYRQTTAKTR